MSALDRFRADAHVGMCSTCNRETLVGVFPLGMEQVPLCFICANIPGGRQIGSLDQVMAGISLLLDTLKPPRKPRAPRAPRQMTRRR